MQGERVPNGTFGVGAAFMGTAGGGEREEKRAGIGNRKARGNTKAKKGGQSTGDQFNSKR
jgi:hypothetical protein